MRIPEISALGCSPEVTYRYRVRYSISSIDKLLPYGTYLTHLEINGKLLFSVADQGCLSWIPDPNFSIPDPGKKDSGSRIRTKEFKYSKPKKLFLSSRKMIWDVHPGSGFFSIPGPDPGSRGQKSTGSRILTHNTASITYY
jgi:hypothetical protein